MTKLPFQCAELRFAILLLRNSSVELSDEELLIFLESWLRTKPYDIEGVVSWTGLDKSIQMEEESIKTSAQIYCANVFYSLLARCVTMPKVKRFRCVFVFVKKSLIYQMMSHIVAASTRNSHLVASIVLSSMPWQRRYRWNEENANIVCDGPSADVVSDAVIEFVAPLCLKWQFDDSSQDVVPVLSFLELCAKKLFSITPIRCVFRARRVDCFSALPSPLPLLTILRAVDTGVLIN
jgi:hypothetical protein